MSAFILTPKKTEVCYGDLGCFNDLPPFQGGTQRPIGYLPKSPTEINTKFLLRTRAKPTSDVQDIISDKASVLSSSYDGKKKTKIVVHGFTHNGHRQWLQNIAAEFLKNEDMNVIIVDWQQGAAIPYDQATANTRVVGAQVAQLIHVMMNATGATPDKFHVLGHSLGAHIGGYVGERVNKLGRITGIDPAGPYFEGTPPIVRLDPSDAEFVDCIHTDGSGVLSIGMGTKQAMGDVDFYPNGGENQPGCDTSVLGKLAHTVWNAATLGLYGAEAAVSCSHERSYYLFTETINSPCPFKAFPCASQKDFDAGKCLHCHGNGCSNMGYHADKTAGRGSLYLETESASTFCDYHYQLNISSESAMDGLVKAKLHGTKSDTNMLPLNKKSEIYNSGNVMSHLIKTRADIGTITGVTLEYDKTASILTNWLYPDDWKLMGVSVFSGKDETSTSFCAYGKSLKSHSQSDFKVTGHC
ncbi:inactive pancreatic lipase-related protein 1 [Patella vulgata]|uniref:inactive pancreatic lipase-related protein 1 n=1 Tax=Patella vulgata TaxID=6465 RepID=UPI0024A7AB6F|nr:inactive pancreatic lipase-related protein 1 [Patella vulgata]